MFFFYGSHLLIFGGDHSFVKNGLMLAFGIVVNNHSWFFSPEIHVVCLLIISERLIFLTHMCFLAIITFLQFWWRRFFGKKILGVSLGITEKYHLWFFKKMQLMTFFTQKISATGLSILDERLLPLPHTCVIAINHILRFLVETIFRDFFLMLAFGITINDHLCQSFDKKCVSQAHRSSTKGSYSLPHRCFLVINCILRLFMQTISL